MCFNDFSLKKRRGNGSFCAVTRDANPRLPDEANECTGRIDCQLGMPGRYLSGRFHLRELIEAFDKIYKRLQSASQNLCRFTAAVDPKIIATDAGYRFDQLARPRDRFGRTGLRENLQAPDAVVERLGIVESRYRERFRSGRRHSKSTVGKFETVALRRANEEALLRVGGFVDQRAERVAKLLELSRVLLIDGR